MNGEQERESTGVNPGYAHWQIARALSTSEEHKDPATRERARQRVEKWVHALGGMLDGSIATGSRTPLDGVPAWATLEVVTGGFATGGLLAAGPIREHERQLLSELSLPLDGRERLTLNRFYLTDSGLSRLQGMLAAGSYEIEVPEEGALLVVAWLIEHDQAESARRVLDEISPLMSTLRFYPRPVEVARRSRSEVFVQSVATTLDALKKIQSNPRILAQQEAIEVWIPMYDAAVNLFLETVDGVPPTIVTTDEGTKRVTAVEGGWPCQVYPEGWQPRATELLADYADRRLRHRLCGKPDRRNENFFQLRQFLKQCVEHKDSLGSKDIARIRTLLARCVTRRGVPGSSEFTEIRTNQSRQARGPTFHELSQVVAARLATHHRDCGIDDLGPVLCSVSAEESERYDFSGTADIPEPIKRKVMRCLNGTADELIRRGVITSGETLARVLPQFTSGLRAAGIIDASLRNVYATVYRAFRRRRSLLLLNLESQVKIEELPWVRAIDEFRRHDLTASELARGTLQEITALTLISFPHAIIPNTLLRELRELAKQADLDLPLVDELAADIFMGRFSGKFIAAAKRAGKMLANSLYATYYGIDYGLIEQFPDGQRRKKASWFRSQSRANDDYFATLCRDRSGTHSGRWDVVVNGMIIEQQQILTTQNLAVLVSDLDLLQELRGHLFELSCYSFNWICKRLQNKPADLHSRAIALKNSAYAWRQMIFFLALMSANELTQFLVWANERLCCQPAEFQARFRPAVEGLCRAAVGKPPEDGGVARRFLGWTKDRHWL